MADLDTSITIDGLQAAIQAQLAAQFPDFKTLEFDREDEERDLPTPAMLLDCEEIEPAPEDDAGTGQFTARIRFCARIVMGRRDPAVKLQVRKAAAAVATFIQKHHFDGVHADECEVTACMVDEFDPVMDHWAVWRVEWYMLVMLGDSAWNNDGTVPESFFSFSPDIGLPNKDAYQPAVPE